MRTFTDQLNRTVSVNDGVSRIVSLVPSQTELLHDLGLNDRVVGITKFCVRPEGWLRKKMRVGGTKELKLDVIQQLRPDLILANKEENTEEQVKQLAAQFPVWVSDVKTLSDALDMIGAAGEIAGAAAQASEIENQIGQAFDQLEEPDDKLRAAYFVWHEPMMVAGGDTFISHMMDRFGVSNVFAQRDRYPEVSADQLHEASPDVLMLSSEPYPFSEKHVPGFQRICFDAQILLVDGQMFSWYGSRLLHAPNYFRELISSIPSWEARSGRVGRRLGVGK